MPRLRASKRTNGQGHRRPGLIAEFWPLVAIASAVVALCGLILWLFVSKNPAGAQSNKPTISLPQGADLHARLVDFEPEEIRLFNYPVTASESKTILVQRNSRNNLRIAFATCGNCDASGKPAYVKGGRVYCGRCRTPMHIPDKYDANQLTRPSCDAVSIPFTRKDGEIVVDAVAIQKRARDLSAQEKPSPP